MPKQNKIILNGKEYPIKPNSDKEVNDNINACLSILALNLFTYIAIHEVNKDEYLDGFIPSQSTALRKNVDTLYENFLKSKKGEA